LTRKENAPPAGSRKKNRHLPAFVLLFLARDGELHGGAINEKFKAIWPPGWSFDPGAVYRTLRVLEQSGAVSSYWKFDSGPPQRIYRLTDEGWRELEQWEKDIAPRVKNLQYFLAEYARLAAGRKKRGVTE